MFTRSIIRANITPWQTRRTITSVPVQRKEGWLYVDSVFPIQLATWDLRHYIGLFRQEFLLNTLLSKLSSVDTHNFQVLALEPQFKDGGVFVHFAYTHPTDVDVLEDIEAAVRDEAFKRGGFPSWTGLGSGNAWLVKGIPWREDLSRYASPILRVAFEGQDVQEQTLYQTFRRYGRIRDLSQPVPVPAGCLRFSNITFQHIRSATIARNVAHCLDVSVHMSSVTTTTRLRAAYQKPVQAHAVRDWMSSHPKIMLPVIVFLLGTLTYTIFDPIRSLMVEGKMLNWFDYTEYSLYQWLRENTLDRLSTPTIITSAPRGEVWKERSEAENALRVYLNDMPTTIAFVHGPQGSGKTRMLQTVLKERGRSTLIIDCRYLQMATSDSQLVTALAQQTGYWPIFSFLNSINSLVDLASVGLIGQKAGLSNSLADQLQQVLGAVATALKRVSHSHRLENQRQIRSNNRREAEDEQRLVKYNQILAGTWHDGRLDCVAGNGIMSELGVGDEPFGVDAGAVFLRSEVVGSPPVKGDYGMDKQEKIQANMDIVNSLPIVIIKNYGGKVGTNGDELLSVLAQWAAYLTENQIAHIIFLSDNRENAKRLVKALPSKPLYPIALFDADAASSLSFMKQKLRDAGVNIDFTPEQIGYVARLGGRASDLESLIHKVRSGQTIEDAVEDIINHGVSELRKNAFGEDADDAKHLPWTREQVWRVIKLLSRQPEVPYYDILIDFPFKGDEMALRSMEHAEILTIATKDGRPSIIKPGKPVFRWVFERLVKDRAFQASQDIAYNEKTIAKAESKILSCEEELQRLGEIMITEPRHWYDWIIGRKSACKGRARYLAEKMLAAEKKIERCERQNLKLQRVLAQGG